MCSVFLSLAIIKILGMYSSFYTRTHTHTPAQLLLYLYMIDLYIKGTNTAKTSLLRSNCLPRHFHVDVPAPRIPTISHWLDLTLQPSSLPLPMVSFSQVLVTAVLPIPQT